MQVFTRLLEVAELMDFGSFNSVKEKHCKAYKFGSTPTVVTSSGDAQLID